MGRMESKRILVVDDEASIRDLLREAITAAGWEVDTAADATEALRLVKENLYDAAVIDFALPDMNGMRLHREIRGMDDELGRRTMFISGLAQSVDRLDYYGADAGGFLPKPFDVSELLHRLGKLLES
jgi:DNA-binding response OmpR family regulator